MSSITWRYPHFLPPFRQVRNLTHVIFQFFYTLKDLIVGSRGVVFDRSSGYFHHAITASLGLADLSSVYAIVLHVCWLSLCMKKTVLCNVTLSGLRLARKASLTKLSPTKKFAYRQLPQYIGFQQTSDVIACIDGQSIKYLPVVMYFCQLKHHIANYVMYVSFVVEIIVKMNWKLFVTRHSKWFWYDFFLLCCIFRCGEPRSWAWCEADMSLVIEASWRVHWRHVTWPLVGVKVSL